ncbi:hypothetical protein UlMin_035458 [Ulmus minor]
MALVAHYDLELHQMDVKTTFLNGDIDETIYMVQPENFVSEDSKNMVCNLTKSIYGLKQASRQWYFKFHQIIVSYGFEANLMDECVYHKFSGSKYIFLVLYVDDILLATNDISILHDTKRFLSKHFEMKDLGDASFVLGIHIHRDRSRGDTPVAKGDKFSLNQCPKNSLESQEMQKIPYASAVGSLMYAQEIGSVRDHWVFPSSDFAGCQDSRRSTSGYIYLLAGGAISWRSAKQTLITSSTMERIRLQRDYHPRSFMSTLLIWVLSHLRISKFSGTLYYSLYIALCYWLELEDHLKGFSSYKVSSSMDSGMLPLLIFYSLFYSGDSSIYEIRAFILFDFNI